MAAPIYYTADMVRDLPDDGNRYETVYGELLVTPAPRALHQVVLGTLFLELGKYLEREPVGRVLSSPADISWASDILVQPDLFVVSLDQLRPLQWSAMRDLMLAVEVLSPSSVRADRFTKRRLYQAQQVPLYWVVDADAASVEVWTPDQRLPMVAQGRLEWRPAGAGRAFELGLDELFRPL